MGTIQLINLTTKELINQMRVELLPELKKELSQDFSPKQPTEYLTRKEVFEMFGISQSTENRWRKSGKIKAYSIGNRVYYKRSEIDAVVNKNSL